MQIAASHRLVTLFPIARPRLENRGRHFNFSRSRRENSNVDTLIRSVESSTI